MLNKVIQSGRLVVDPELRRTQSGIAVATFRLAIERDYAEKDGSRQADFFEYVAWRGTAEFISKYFSKGQMITVEGAMRTRSWEDRDGKKQYRTEVLVEKAYFAGQKPTGKKDDAPEPETPPITEYAELDGDDGELPF